MGNPIKGSEVKLKKIKGEWCFGSQEKNVVWKGRRVRFVKCCPSWFQQDENDSATETIKVGINKILIRCLFDL